MHQVWEPPTYMAMGAPHSKLCQKRFPIPFHRQRSTQTSSYEKKRGDRGRPQNSYLKDEVQNTHSRSKALNNKDTGTYSDYSYYPHGQTLDRHNAHDHLPHIWDKLNSGNLEVIKQLVNKGVHWKMKTTKKIGLVETNMVMSKGTSLFSQMREMYLHFSR